MVSVLAEARDAGTIEHVGVSEVSIEEIELARTVVPIAAVQNEYSLGERKHEEVLDFCAEQGIPFVPFFPLRGGDREAIAEVAAAHGATPQQVKLAWLLKRSADHAADPGDALARAPAREPRRARARALRRGVRAAPRRVGFAAFAMTPAETKRRNYLIAGTVGGFLLPVAGLVGALAFWAQGDEPAAIQVAAASIAGVIAYVVVFGVL